MSFPAASQSDRSDHDSAANAPCVTERSESKPAPVSARIAQWRHAAGLSVEALSDRTKIKRRYIEALEAGDFGALPPVAFAAGYVKIIAQTFGQDGDQLSRDFRREAGGAKPASAPTVAPTAETTRKTAEAARTAGQSVSAMALGGFALVAGGALWGFFSLTQLTSPSPQSVAPVSDQPGDANSGARPVAVAKTENQTTPSRPADLSPTLAAADTGADPSTNPHQTGAYTTDRPTTRDGVPLAKTLVAGEGDGTEASALNNPATATATASPAPESQGTVDTVKSIAEPRITPAPVEKKELAQNATAPSAGLEKEPNAAPEAQGDESSSPPPDPRRAAKKQAPDTPNKQRIEAPAAISPPPEPQPAAPADAATEPPVNIIRGPIKFLPTDRSLNRLTGLPRVSQEPGQRENAKKNSVTGANQKPPKSSDRVRPLASGAPEKSAQDKNKKDIPSPAQTPETPIIQPATLSERINPDYPDRCKRRAKSRETVTISFTLSEFGTVQDARIAETTNRCFSRTALDAVRQWRYNPRLKDGQPVQSAEKSVSIRFDQR